MVRTVKVLCGDCGAEIEILEWGLYDFWFPFYDKKVNPVRQYLAPHGNRGHPCKKCNRYWLSSDGLELIADNDDGIVYRFN
jgi:hypothetical protein